MMRHGSLSVVAMSGLFFGTPCAQALDTPTVFPASSDLVQIDVAVTDGRGGPVAGLTASDFELREDGKLQTITHFSAVAPSRAASVASERTPSVPVTATAAPPALAAPRQRYLLVVVDDLHLKPANLIHAKHALLRFIDDPASLWDKLALAVTSGQYRLFQEFTNDRAALRRAVERVAAFGGIEEVDAETGITPYQADQIERGDQQALTLAVNQIQTRDVMLPRNVAARMAEVAASRIAAESSQRARHALSTVDGLVRDLARLAGRKIVILVSDGFPVGQSGFSAEPELERLADAATRAGATVYALDARGLIATPPGGDASTEGRAMNQLTNAIDYYARSAEHADRDGMGRLAAETGGLLVTNRNDLAAGLREIAEDSTHYYILGYAHPPGRADGRFRRIQLKVTGHAGLSVRTRRGYYATLQSPRETIPDQAVEREAFFGRAAEAALKAVVPYRDIPVEMEVVYAESKDGPVAFVRVHLDAAALHYREEGDAHCATLRVAGVVLDDKGAVVTNFGDRVDIKLSPAQRDGILKRGYRYDTQIPLRPGRFFLRLVALDAGASAVRLGSASDWLDVPDVSQKRMALSGLFLYAQPHESTEIPGSEAATPAGLGRAPVSHAFDRNEKVYYQAFLYNAALPVANPDDLELRAELWADDRMLRATAPGPVSVAAGIPTRIPVAGWIGLAEIEPGEYAMRVVIRDRRSGVEATRSTSLSIR